MKLFFCILIGYLVGSCNPAALISRLKHKSLRDKGTGNLGATNTMLVFGKKLGAFVLLLDILKGFLIFKLGAWMGPELEELSFAAGLAVVLGHCFPFYMHFKGGKGLAAFAGIVLAYRPELFFFLLVSGMALMLLVNHSFILPFYAALCFAVSVAFYEDGLIVPLLATCVSALIIWMHFGNFVRAVKGKDRKIRDYLQSKRSEHSGTK